MHCKDAPRYVSRKFRKSLTKQFLEVAYIFYTYLNYICQLNTKISVVSLSQSKIYR